MKYRDRNGNEYSETTSQDKLLAKAYSNVFGRSAMKILACPFISKASRIILNSRISASFVPSFAEKNHIDMFDYEDRKYKSFNDFFTRKIKPSRRFITKEKSTLISPCDCKVSAYEITNSCNLLIKNSLYSIESLLRDKKLAQRYNGGYALVCRLSVDDYHHYLYPCTGIKSHNRIIHGVLHTVNPVASKYFPIYKENSREYCMIRSQEMGDVIMMEVGALLVGKITNLHPYGRRQIYTGEEKGYFEFGGSTVILLLEKNKAEVCQDLLDNTAEGFETKLLQGERLGVSRNY